MSLEDRVAEHYTVGDLAERLLQGLRASGEDAERFEADAVAPVDEFHIGGRPATEHLAALLDFPPDAHVLDLGCGLGGAARFFAERGGVRVTGIDLTPEYVEVARLVSARTGLEARTTFDVGNACDLPYADAHFDGAVTLHVAMNIPDRASLYAEAARVLKPGARFGVYDVMRGPSDGLVYPVPWAEDASTSHLTTPDEMRALLDAAGFEILAFQDRTAFGLEFFRALRARVAGGEPPSLGLHLLMGAAFPAKMANMIAGLERGHVLPGVLIAERR